MQVVDEVVEVLAKKGTAFAVPSPWNGPAASEAHGASALHLSFATKMPSFDSFMHCHGVVDDRRRAVGQRADQERPDEV